MAARGTRRKPTKTLHPKPREKKVGLRLAPQLTRSEARQLQERAAADMRSIGGYVAFLVIEDLRRRGRGRRHGRAAAQSDQRVSYDIAVSLTPDQETQLQAQSTAQVRSVSSYVARLIVEDLASLAAEVCLLRRRSAGRRVRAQSS
jgi:hypothetical protein